MARQRELHPAGLTRSQFECLVKCADDGVEMLPEQLLQGTDQHLQNADSASQRNRFINVKLARAIGDAIQQVIAQWESIADDARYWLTGAVLYFSSSNDDEPDFSSPIGFEDDTEVLNACLRFANLDHLCLKVENYDDV